MEAVLPALVYALLAVRFCSHSACVCAGMVWLTSDRSVLSSGSVGGAYLARLCDCSIPTPRAYRSARLPTSGSASSPAARRPTCSWSAAVRSICCICSWFFCACCWPANSGLNSCSGVGETCGLDVNSAIIWSPG